MASFELVETGLTADKFIIKRTGQSPAAESANPGSPPRLKQVSARVSARNALLSGETGLVGRLSVRGLNFVNALVEMTGGHAIDVSFLEIHPYQVALEGWRRPDSMLVRYHLVCESSERAHVRSGDERQPLNTGDLFRVVHENEPTIFHGGEAGSLSLVVTLKRAQAPSRQAREPASLPTSTYGLSNRAMRWGAAS